MKKISLIFVIIFFATQTSFAQKLIKDIDFDGKKDTVYVDNTEFRIICRLSTQNFKKIKSKQIEILNEMSGIVDAKNGFAFFNDWMPAGYKNQFRYNKKTKKIQLIGMSRYEFGNVVGNGSGESSVNLLTNDYIGNWNYFDDFANNEEGELVKIPTIKTKMKFKEINLEDFEENTYFGFADRCSELYYQQKEKLQKKRN